MIICHDSGNVGVLLISLPLSSGTTSLDNSGNIGVLLISPPLSSGTTSLDSSGNVGVLLISPPLSSGTTSLDSGNVGVLLISPPLSSGTISLDSSNVGAGSFCLCFFFVSQEAAAAKTENKNNVESSRMEVKNQIIMRSCLFDCFIISSCTRKEGQNNEL